MTITNDLVELSIEANRNDRGHLKFDFPELKIGTADYTSAQTGCTVFSFEQRAMMVSDCRGGAIGAIGTHYPEVDAICFAGGSAYGQEAILGVGAEIHKRANYSTDWQDIALAAGAIIYDYRFRENAVYPDKALGRAALNAAKPNLIAQGNVGAGFSASAGKCLTEAGYEGERTGQGAAFRQVGQTKIFIATVLNPLGAIVNKQGKVVRGNLAPTTGERVHLHEHANGTGPAGKGNTTLTLMVTNQRMPRQALSQVAKQVHSSMARGIQPFHTEFDGDVFYAVSTEQVSDPNLAPFALGAIASELAWDAILAAANAD
ncbi:P1 family peptidase [Maritalea porphyrae]|uniref:P1 family peptidase n=1 Tax=Maritalea porphyrae TaxID=880732 RepID=UPI0022AEF03B|nr:P1 family peptidase [Maritalea porphyrae]MCZ4273273.1 P1 family peptidase [Maritalea porphyrae]